MAKTEIKSVVLKGSEHDVKNEGVRAVDEETYNRVAVAGGFGDPSQEPVGSSYRSPLDIQGLRVLKDDTKADAGRRQSAGDRLAEIESILNPPKEGGK